MPGVELMPIGVELVGGATLVCFARIDGSATPDHRSRPSLAPKIVELHRVFVNADRMQGVAFERPGAGLRLEIGEEAGLRVFSRRAGGEAARHRGRPPDNVADPLAVEQS